jgi:hypothetical protein
MPHGIHRFLAICLLATLAHVSHPAWAQTTAPEQKPPVPGTRYVPPPPPPQPQPQAHNPRGQPDMRQPSGPTSGTGGGLTISDFPSTGMPAPGRPQPFSGGGQVYPGNNTGTGIVIVTPPGSVTLPAAQPMTREERIASCERRWDYEERSGKTFGTSRWSFLDKCVAGLI